MVESPEDHSVARHRNLPHVPADLSATQLRSWLIETFGEYDFPIGLQTSLVDHLIRAVQRDTDRGVRRQCAAVATDIGDRQVIEAAMEAADAIARAIRWGRSGL